MTTQLKKQPNESNFAFTCRTSWFAIKLIIKFIIECFSPLKLFVDIFVFVRFYNQWKDPQQYQLTEDYQGLLLEKNQALNNLISQNQIQLNQIRDLETELNTLKSKW